MKFMNIKGPWLIIDRWLAWCILPIIIFLSQKSYRLISRGRYRFNTDKFIKKEIEIKRLKNEKILIEYVKEFVKIDDFIESYPDIDTKWHLKWILNKE